MFASLVPAHPPQTGGPLPVNSTLEERRNNYIDAHARWRDNDCVDTWEAQIIARTELLAALNKPDHDD